MPDDHPLDGRPYPERIDLSAIKSDLEFLIERVSRLPTRRELALNLLSPRAIERCSFQPA
jgi:hypothetical protein